MIKCGSRGLCGSRGWINAMFDQRIEFESQTTHIAVRVGSLAEVGPMLHDALAPEPVGRVFVVTDRNVWRLHGERLSASLRAAGLDHDEVVIPPGEGSKSLERLGEVYAALARFELDREGVILAFGGGVISDLAGLAAATWMRGVRFAICPTTLEADIDASIGGKTAVNISGAKNLVGAFHQPVLVTIDPDCLQTLDRRDVRAGLAESVKHALISSEEFLRWHEANVDRILALDEGVITELIRRNVEVKAAVVREDPLERTGRRMVLNFGHTIGHGIEACTGFALRHGECVALGMLAACRLSRGLGLIEETLVERVATLLGRFGLPTRVEQPVETERVMETLRVDKKVRDRATRFVLLEGVGRPVVRSDVPQELVREAYESLLP